jgi:hypothetical protein
MITHPSSAEPARLPEPLPDETLYSLFARIHWLNDYDNARECCAMLLGDGERLRVADSRFDPVHFDSATRGFYGGVQLILTKMTPIGFFHRLGTHPNVETPRRLRPGDADALAVSNGLATLSNGRAHIWRWCPLCLKRDHDIYSVAYWHRKHQLPGVVVCNEHHMSLIEATLPYQVRQQEFIMPGRLPDRARVKPACSTVPPPTATSLAQFAEQILLDNAAESSPECVRGALVDGLTQAGLVSRSGRIRKKPFIAEWTNVYADMAELTEFAAPLNERCLPSLVDALNHQGSLLPATTTVLLADWLFGSWQLFKEHCRWRKAFHFTDPMCKRRLDKGAAIPPEGMRKNHRDTCVEFLKSYPGATRKDFWVTHPKSCRWLHTHDLEWLQHQLPTAHRCSVMQLELFQ